MMEYKEDCKSCIYLNKNGTCGNTRSIMFGVATNSGEPQLCNDRRYYTRESLRNRKRNVKYKAFMTMNKIKEKLIHWLGGVTKEEHNKWLEYKESHGKYMLLNFCYQKQSDYMVYQQTNGVNRCISA